MEKAKITFENKDGSKKALLTIITKGKGMEIKIIFNPEIKGDSKDFYAQLAAMYMKHLTGA